MGHSSAHGQKNLRYDVSESVLAVGQNFEKTNAQERKKRIQVRTAWKVSQKEIKQTGKQSARYSRWIVKG